MSLVGHAWTAPGCQGTLARCSLGRSSHAFGLFSAVHMTAGHNALRGSGPGHKLAFNDALAQVGCPDHRIDRSALRAVRPFQPSRLAT